MIKKKMVMPLIVSMLSLQASIAVAKIAEADKIREAIAARRTFFKLQDKQYINRITESPGFIDISQENIGFTNEDIQEAWVAEQEAWAGNEDKFPLMRAEEHYKQVYKQILKKFEEDQGDNPSMTIKEPTHREFKNEDRFPHILALSREDFPKSNQHQQKILQDALGDLNVKIKVGEFGKIPNLLQKAKVDSPSDDLKIYFYDDSLRKVLQSVNEKDGFVEMDCQMFAQVAAHLLAGRADQPFFTLFKGKVSIREICPGEVEIGLLAPKQEEARNIIERFGTNLTRKVIWLVKAGDQWVGLTDNGIEWLTKEEWKARRKNLLLTECENIIANGASKNQLNILYTQAKIIHLYIAKGTFDEWELLTSKEYY